MDDIQNKNVIVIIDAWSGGKYLIPAFQALGYPCLHVQTEFVPDHFKIDNALSNARCDRRVVYNGNLAQLLDVLRPYRIKAVLPGSEGAVGLADAINGILELDFANASVLSSSRRDKYQMQETIRRAGLSAINQVRVSDKTTLSTWLDEQNRWPVVVKPLRSAGTDGVAICHSRHEAQAALVAILNRPNLFGEQNTAALCQEFLEGEEFVVNGVARDGVYMVTELWHSAKQDNCGSPIYGTQYLRVSQDPEYPTLVAYVEKVCSALGLKNGPFHAEVMLTKTGPVLIEIGARVAGGADPYVVEQCLGHSQISKTVDAVLRPDCFLRDLRESRPIRAHAKAAYIFLVSPIRGRLQRSPKVDFTAIDGVLSVRYNYCPGEIQNKTVDLMTAPGTVIVIADNCAQLDAIINRVRTVEAEFFLCNLVPME